MEGVREVFFRNRKGSVLVVVLIVMITLTILGATLGSLAVRDQKQAARQQRNNESLYLARSGAEAVAAYLLENQELIQDYIGQEDVVEMGSGSFLVKVVEGPNNTILIQSTGYVGNYSQSITLSLICGEVGSPFPIFDMALFVDGDISMESGSPRIFGNVGTNTTKARGIRLGNGLPFFIMGDCYIGPGGNIPVVFPENGRVNGRVSNLDEKRTYPMPDFPEYPSLPTKPNIKTNWDNKSPLISSDGYYDTITIDQNYELRINTGQKGELRRVRVRDFNGSQGKVIIEGEGRLLLYVEDRFVMKGYFNQDGDPNQAIIFYNGTSNITFFGETQLYASLFANYKSDNATMSLVQGADIYGSVFTNAKKVTVTGGSAKNVVRVFYAPQAEFLLDEGGAIYGAVVANQYVGRGNAKIEYHQDVNHVWELVPEIIFEDFEGEQDMGGFVRGYWSD